MGWLSKWWSMSNPNPSRNYGTQLFFPSLYGQNPQKLQDAQSQQFMIQKILGNLGLSNLTGPATTTAYGNLLKNLQSNGRTDPLALNAELSDIGRSENSNVGAIQGSAAAGNLGGSGLAQALMASTRAGAAGQRQNAVARENALAEERKRADIDQFLRVILGPSIDQLALATNQYSQAKQGQSQDTGSAAGAVGGILKALFGGLGG